MFRISGMFAALSLSASIAFASVALADCAGDCKNGFDASCMRRCGMPQNMTKRPTRLADQCGASSYSCSGTCCYSTSRGYYCADANGDC